jgi:hypothetical protein
VGVVKKKSDYIYDIMFLIDAQRLKHKEVFVPNSTTSTALELLRWFRGHRRSFPCYADGSLLITGMDESAWMTPREYSQHYCPPEMACIVRNLDPNKKEKR